MSTSNQRDTLENHDGANSHGGGCRESLAKDITMTDWKNLKAADKAELPPGFDNGFTLEKAPRGGIENLNPSVEFILDNYEKHKAQGMLPDEYTNVNEFCIREGLSLGREFSEAYKSGDFTKLNIDLQNRFDQAFKMAGLDGVRKLEQQINEHSDVAGVGPVVLESDHTRYAYFLNGTRDDSSATRYIDLRIRTARNMTAAELEQASGMTSQEREKAGIVSHPTAGFLKIVNTGASLTYNEDDMYRYLKQTNSR